MLTVLSLFLKHAFQVLENVIRVWNNVTIFLSFVYFYLKDLPREGETGRETDRQTHTHTHRITIVSTSMSSSISPGYINRFQIHCAVLKELPASCSPRPRTMHLCRGEQLFHPFPYQAYQLPGSRLPALYGCCATFIHGAFMPNTVENLNTPAPSSG